MDFSPVKSIYVQIDGISVDVFYNINLTNSSPPVLMVHGMFGGGWYFYDWAIFLAQKGFPVYVIRDLHEWENLNKVDFYTYLRKSTSVDKSIYGNTGKKIIIIGHSMGGLIVQKIAEIRQELVAGIVLFASAPSKGISAMTWRVAKAMVKNWFSLLFNLPLKIDRESAFDLLLNWKGDEEKKEQIFQKLVPESSRVLRQLAFSQIAVNEKKISCKSLVVSCRFDRLLPLEVQQQIATKYDSYYLSFFTGHLLMLEFQQEEIICGILRWINEFSEF